MVGLVGFTVSGFITCSKRRSLCFYTQKLNMYIWEEYLTIYVLNFLGLNLVWIGGCSSRLGFFCRLFPLLLLPFLPLSLLLLLLFGLLWSFLLYIAENCTTNDVRFVLARLIPERFKQGDFFRYVLYSTLLHLPPLRFHCVKGCWDPGQLRLRHWLSDALATRLYHPQTRLHLVHKATSYPLVDKLTRFIWINTSLKNLRISFSFTWKRVAPVPEHDVLHRGRGRDQHRASCSSGSL